MARAIETDQEQHTNGTVPRYEAIKNHPQRPLWVRLTGKEHAECMRWLARAAWAWLMFCLLVSLMTAGG